MTVEPISSSSLPQGMREQALARIERTPELTHLSHLLDVKWQDSSPFWEWVASATYQQLLNIEDTLNPLAISQRAYSMAGSAVIGRLLYMDPILSTIIPDFKKQQLGRVVCQQTLRLRLECSLYEIWRTSVQLLASSAAEERVTCSISPRNYNEIASAIGYLRYGIQPELQDNFRLIVVDSIYILINHLPVWHMIDQTAKQLIQKGQLDEEEIATIVSQISKNEGKGSKILRQLRKVQLATFGMERADPSTTVSFLGQESQVLARSMQAFSLCIRELFSGQDDGLQGKLYRLTLHKPFWEVSLDKLKTLTNFAP